MNKYEKILDKFISIERKKTRRGSGDDGFYEQQIEDYVNEQRKFWIAFIKFIEKKLKTKKNIPKLKNNFTKSEEKVLKELINERIDDNLVSFGQKTMPKTGLIPGQKKSKKKVCVFLIKETGRCNSKYWKNKKCDKKKCPWRFRGSYAMAVADAPNRLK